MKRVRPSQPPWPVRWQVIAKQLLADPGSVNIFLHCRRDEESSKQFECRVLALLAEKLGCTVSDLRLDHTWALRTRKYRPRKDRPVASWYAPHAHDPDHLIYRPHGAEFEGSHHIKTNVRGDGAQFPDRVLIKRERRREKNEAKPPRNKLPRQAKDCPTQKIPARKNPWPPKGSRPFNRKRNP